MKQRSIHIENGDPLEKLMDILDRKVFHVSLTSNWAKISKSGKIIPNIDNTHETTFGSSSNSYFKNKGCVSVFDYRNIHDEEAQKHIHKCCPTRPLLDGKGITIFILKPETHACLITWKNWKNEDLRQMIVSYIEAGYPGAISLDSIEEVIFVTMKEDQNSLASALRRAWQKSEKELIG